MADKEHRLSRAIFAAVIFFFCLVWWGPASGGEQLARHVLLQSATVQRHAVLLESQPDPAVQADTSRTFQQEVAKNVPALFMSIVVGALANAAGVGGGAFFVPLFNILLEFSLKGSTAISQAVITGGAISSVAYAFTKRSPIDPWQPLMDFHLALMLTPMLLFGVSVGVLLNVLFPDWLITGLLTLLLLYLTYRTVRKSLSLHRAEQRYRQLQSAISTPRGEPPPQPPSLQPRVSSSAAPAGASRPPAAQPQRRASAVPRAASTGIPSAPAAGDSVRAEATARTGSVELPSAGAQRMVSAADEARAAAGTAHKHPSGTPRKRASVQRDIASAALAQPEPETPPAARQASLSRAAAADVAVVDVEDLNMDSPDEGAHPAARSTGDRVSFNGEGEVPPARLPWVQVLQVFVLWGAFLTLQLLKSRHQRCEVAYFAYYSAQAVLSVVSSVYFVYQAHHSHVLQAQQALRRQLLRSIYEEGVDWTLPRLVRATIITLVGGAIAGLLGIGGGMIIGPLLLELGVHPLVTAATSSLMVLFSSSSAALSYGFEGVLNVQYSLIYGAACFVSSLIGVTIVNRIVKKSGKASVVVMILAFIIGLGAVLTAGFGGRKAILNLESGKSIGFNKFCP